MERATRAEARVEELAKGAEGQNHQSCDLGGGTMPRAGRALSYLWMIAWEPGDRRNFLHSSFPSRDVRGHRTFSRAPPYQPPQWRDTQRDAKYWVGRGKAQQTPGHASPLHRDSLCSD